jgi:asparagine synthetase A
MGIGSSRVGTEEHIDQQIQVGVWPSEMKAAIPGML